MLAKPVCYFTGGIRLSSCFMFSVSSSFLLVMYISWTISNGHRLLLQMQIGGYRRDCACKLIDGRKCYEDASESESLLNILLVL
jgi:hypothetical protein